MLVCCFLFQKIKFEDLCAKIEHQLFQLVIVNHLFLKDPVGIICSFQLTTGQRRISQLIALRQEESQGQVPGHGEKLIFDANEKYT